jgi:hypothetical protein
MKLIKKFWKWILLIIGVVVFVAWKKGKVNLPGLTPSRVTGPGVVLKDARNVTFEFRDTNLTEDGQGFAVYVNGNRYGTLSEMWLDDGVVYGVQKSGNKYKFAGEWVSI